MTAGPAGERARQLAALCDAVVAHVAPAIVRYRDFLRDRLLPAARREREGLAGLPGGEAAYRATIRYYVGLPMEPAELHALGRAEITHRRRAGRAGRPHPRRA